MSQGSPLTPCGWETAGVENNYQLTPLSSVQAEGGRVALRVEGMAGRAGREHLCTWLYTLAAPACGHSQPTGRAGGQLAEPKGTRWSAEWGRVLASLSAALMA